MKRKIANVLFSIFFLGSPRRRAIASSIGLFLGFLPLHGYQWIIGICLALIFRLNLIALFLGLSMYLLIPFTSLVMQKLDLPDPFSIMPDQSLFSLISGILIASLFFPVFSRIYRERKRRKYLEREKHFVFQDYGRRWAFLKRSVILLFVLAIVTGLVFAESIRVNPVVPEFAHGDHEAITPISEGLSNRELSAGLKYQKFDPSLKRNIEQSGEHTENKPIKSYGFYVPWDPRSWIELKEYGYIRKLDVLIPQWYSIGEDFSLVVHRQPEVDQLAKENNVEIMPLINNVHEGQWDGELLHQLLSSPQKRSELIQQLLQQVQQHGYAGINIDFEAVQPRDKDNLTAFMTELSSAFHQHGFKVTQDVPAHDRAFDYEALSEVVDQLVIMMYDEHYATGKPGPVASLGWVKHTLDQLPVPENKRIVSLGNYGYDWTVNSDQPAVAVTFDEIMNMASQYNLKVHWDEISKNAYVRYKKGNEEHMVWFLDGAAFYNQMKLVSASDVHGVALWRIGSEDLSIWNIFGKTGQLNNIQQMQEFGSEVPLYSGAGEILYIESLAKPGQRSFTLDENKWIQTETYTTYSVPTEIKKTGKPKGKQIALTFDDGPDPAYTEEILDILDRYHIKASFYIVGENAARYPDLVKRMVESGHDVGNHTYTHADLAKTSPFRTKLELNMTQRFFQQLTGHTMATFRPPYHAGATPTSKEELTSIMQGQQYGYTMVGEMIDSLDWKKQSSDAIVQQVMAESSKGNIVLLHDSGGDRSKTVKALPTIIENLKNEGYQFVTASQMMGKTRDQVMPPVHPSEQPYLIFNQIVFSAIRLWQQGFSYVMYAAMGIGFIRVIILMYFSYQQRVKLRRRRRKQNFAVIYDDFNPLVSVVIAAYNEEKVINKTIHSVLQSDYRPLEVIIVNDGSTDRTEEVILQEFGNHPDVWVISKPNGGKTEAINLGYREAYGEIIVSIDADTIIAENTISLLVRHFIDPKVAAVSGNVKVGNVRNLLTLWQHVEYITGFNLERRAFDELNCIPVVPGAIGAWRKSAVEEAGYFQHDTLAEDTDITLTLLRHGYKVQFEDQSLAYTEAPEDMKSFLKQRTRWIYGTLQCLWKHRGALFSEKQKSLGFVTLPNMWSFQYGVQMLSPFVDLLCLFSLFTDYATTTLVFYVLFLVFDMLAAFFAFSLEKESPKPLIWLFLQRFVYRQFMTYLVVKSLVYALKGVSVGWNKLVRKGNVALKETA